MKTAQLAQLLTWVGLVTATPTTWPRAVPSLDAAAFSEAQQRDDTATRAFTNTQIKTSDGKCLFVDKLSGDFRANLTPIQVADCGATDGQGWDVITKGKHNNVANSMLVVSTLTNACFNFDPRRAAGNQVILFSCGGRADGGGQVTNSQLFSFKGATSEPVSFQPENASGQCLAVKGNVLDIASCGGAGQQFTFSGTAASPPSRKMARSITTINKRKKGEPEPIIAGGNSSDILPPPADNGESNNKDNKNGTANTTPEVQANGTAITPPAAVTNSGQGAQATSAAKNGDKNGKKGSKKGGKKGGKDKNNGGKNSNINGATGAGAATAAANDDNKNNNKDGKKGNNNNNNNGTTIAGAASGNNNNGGDNNKDGKKGKNNGGQNANNSNNNGTATAGADAAANNNNNKDGKKEKNNGGKSTNNSNNNGTMTVAAAGAAANNNNGKDKDGKNGKDNGGKNTNDNKNGDGAADAAAKWDKNGSGLLDLAGLL